MGKKEEKKFIVDKNMTFAEILKEKPEAGKLLMKKGFHCIGCPMALHETLEQGATMHGIDINKLIKELNKSTKNGKKKKD